VKGSKPEAKKEQAPNPMLPGATTPPTFQSPYSQMMRPQMPMPPMLNPMQAMQPPEAAAPLAGVSDTSEPPKWFSEYAAMMDKRLGKIEKKKSKPLRKKMDAYDDED